MTLPGTIVYVPYSLVQEANDIKVEKKLKRQSDAMREMVKYSQIGREAERIIKLDFRFKPRNIIEEKGKRLKTWRP